MSKSSLKEPQIPDAQRGDEVYFRHGDGPKSGRVLSSGKHGCTVECDGARHKVRWDAFLGHKVRIQPDYSVVDTGEDGAIVEHGTDRSRRFIRDLDKTAKPGEGPLRKSFLPVVLMFDHGDELAKAIKNGPGLSLQSVTDKAGHQTKRWKRTGQEQPKERKKAAPESGAKAGYGTHNLEPGDEVSFAAGDFKGTGKIELAGKDGATIKDSSGRMHEVHWAEVRGHKPNGKAAAADAAAPKAKVLGEQKAIPEKQFKASDYAKSHDQGDVTPESVLAHFPPDTKDKIAAVQERLKAVEETIDKFKKGKNYQAERQAIHRKIFATMMSPEKIAAAIPPPGQKPTMTQLGGRGGSGKSWFSESKDSPVNTKGAIVLDSDEIKKMLPEYEGWNAHQVHEESSDILKDIENIAMKMGLNVVVDATMRSADSSLNRSKVFKSKGYRIEAHYMHLPRQEAAKRAVSRFLGETQRYVPVDVVLGNKDNEASFDEVRKMSDAWSFRDNNVPKGTEPILISHGGEKATGKAKVKEPDNDDLKKPSGGAK